MKRVLFLLIVILAFGACTTFNQSYELGMDAAINRDWDEAVKHYERALLEDPKNSVYRIALIRAKIAASSSHLILARRLAAQEKKEEALKEYEKALVYDPSNKMIFEEAKIFTGEEAKEEKSEELRIIPPVRLKVSDEKMELKFINETSLRSIFQALGKHTGINILFDEQFKDQPFSVDLSGLNFEQAVNSLCLASKNFFRVIDEKTIIIVPDQPTKRMQYELQVIKTFYLSNIDAQDVQGALIQMLRTQYKVPAIQIDKNLNSVIVRDTPSIVELAGRLLSLWDKPKGEVVIDLEIMEVSRVKLKDLGVELDQYGVGLRYSGVEGESDWIKLKNIDFSRPENFQILLPAAFLRLMESDSDTKIIAQPRLRGVEGEEINYLVGDKIPIPRTTFTPIAAGGVSQQPVTSFEYRDVGIEVNITPRIHTEKEITLNLEVKINALGGSGFADIPIITTREVKNVIRLRDGETNLMAGLLKDEERKMKKGFAGLKNIPLLGNLFSRTEQTIQQTDVIMTITPHIIRSKPIGKRDLEPLWFDVSKIPSSRMGAMRLPEEEIFQRELSQRRPGEERERKSEAEAKNQIFISPSNFEVPKNKEFRVNINIRTIEEIGNMSLNIIYNSQVLKLKQVNTGSFVRQFGKSPSFLKNIDNSSGLCTLGFSSPDIGKGYKGAGSIATLVFESNAKGESTVAVSGITANSSRGKSMVFETKESHVFVR